MSTTAILVRLVEPEHLRIRTSTPADRAPARHGRHRRSHASAGRHRAQRIWRGVARAADIVTTAVVLSLLGVAVAIAGYASYISLQQSDLPWVALLFAVAYLAAGTYLLVVVGQALSRRWKR